MQEPSHTGALEAGIEALSNADWRRACKLLREAVTKEPSSAEAWAGLAAAAYWVPDEEAIFEARERAYHLYRERGEMPNAARMAAWLAVDWIELRGQSALANGWIQRANRLVQKHRDSPHSAWVSILNTRFLMITGAEAGAVRRLAARSATLARQLGLSDIEALSLAAEGHARLSMGDVERAVRCFDEAAAVVLSHEVCDLTAAALTLCSLMGACERTRDFDRARQWCAAARQFSEDRGFPVVLSICRPHYGAVLMWRGHWPEAEEHLQIGSRELMEFLPPFAVGALALLGALRWRQGRWEEAEQIFEQVRHEPPAQVALAEFLAAKGDHQGAIELLQRHLRGVPEEDKLERSPALALLVRCLAALGEHERAAGFLPELNAIADSVRTPAQRAAAAFASGVVASCTTRWEEAQQLLGDAVELYERAGAPFESARARIALAETLSARGRLDTAAREAHIGGETLQRIGAVKESERAAQLVATINAQRSTPAGVAPDRLTPREAEILTLLAQGQSNQDIAIGLVLSIRTVERHISNIYQKLGLEGRTARTAAAAHAHRVNTGLPRLIL